MTRLPTHLPWFNLIAALVFATVCVVIIYFCILHSIPGPSPRAMLVRECDRLMREYINNPSNETFTECYTFMVLNEIKMGEVDQNIFSRWMSAAMPEGWEPPELGGDPSVRKGEEEGASPISCAEPVDSPFNRHPNKFP